MTLNFLKDSFLRPGSQAEIFCKEIKQKGARRHNVRYLGEGIGIVGRPKNVTNLDSNIREALKKITYNYDCIFIFH